MHVAHAVSKYSAATIKPTKYSRISEKTRNFAKYIHEME